MAENFIPVDTKLSLAQQAVTYLLDRIQVDPDLRWHMLGTEAFARLCAAEAERQGKPLEEVEQARREDRQEAHNRYAAGLPTLRQAIDQIDAAFEDACDADAIDRQHPDVQRLAELIEAAQHV